jgi:hypothetical protein
MIISLAMDDRFADEGPNIRPKTFKDIFADKDGNGPFDKLDKPFDLGRAWFKNELDKNLKKGTPVSHRHITCDELRAAAKRAELPVEIPENFEEPSGAVYAVMFDLFQLLQRKYEDRADYHVNYMHMPIPTDMPNYFTDGRTFIRATYNITRYDKALYIHVDFKEKIELYIIHQISLRNTARRMYVFERPDSISMFRAITSEMEQVLNGYFKDKDEAQTESES